MPPDLKQPRTIWLAAVLIVGAGFVLAAVLPDTESAGRSVSGIRAAPPVPLDASTPPMPLQSEFDILVHSRIWRGDPASAKAAAAASAEPQRWWLMAVYGQGPTRAVIVGQTGQPDRILRPGDVLPSGDPIVDITPKGVCVLLNGKRRLLPVVESAAKVW